FLDHGVTLVVCVLVLNPALPSAWIIGGEIQPLRPGRIVKGVGGDFPEAVDAVIFTGGGHGPQVVVGGVNRRDRASAAIGLATELDGRLCRAARRRVGGGG